MTWGNFGVLFGEIFGEKWGIGLFGENYFRIREILFVWVIMRGKYCLFEEL